MYLPFDPAVLLLGIYLTDTSAHIKMIYGYLKFFTIALFVKVKDWKQSRNLSAEEWSIKLWYMHTWNIR